MAKRQNLMLAREEKGLSVGDMADRLGISVWHYYKIEQGSRNPNIHLAKAVADVLGRNVDSLFFQTELDELSKGSTKEASTDA